MSSFPPVNLPRLFSFLCGTIFLVFASKQSGFGCIALKETLPQLNGVLGGYSLTGFTVADIVDSVYPVPPSGLLNRQIQDNFQLSKR
jgi:hypothetical protein